MERVQIFTSLKTVSSSVPNILSLDNGDITTNLFDTVINTFNNHFASTAETTKKSILRMKVVVKYFSNLLIKQKQLIPYSFSTLSKRLPSQIYFFKATGRFVQPIFPDWFTSAIIIPKVVPLFKKYSKLDFSNYIPISLLSNNEKILQKGMYKRLHTFLNNNNIICNLQFGFRQQYSTCQALINITEI